MTRHIVLGNGNLLVNIDKWLQIRDIYYPHVGQENHLLGHAHRIGVYTDRISWLNGDEWDRTISYKKDTLVTECTAINNSMGIHLSINDCVECEKNIFLKKITVTNNTDSKRTIKVFFHHDFHLYGDGIGDTAGYDPERKSIFHYKRRRYFLISASIGCRECDIVDYTVGTADQHTIKDAEDGVLEKNSIAQGSVDSIFSIALDIDAQDSKTFYYWICCGKDFAEVHDLNDFVFKTKPEQLFYATELCWRGFANKATVDFKDLGEDIAEHYKRSVLIIRTQIDNNGAIIAANDSDNMQFNHDTYSYVWPRDGALIAIAMQKAGYPELVKPFYLFCKEVITEEGYFLHKYNPDKSLGSSWHPWVKDGKLNLPIQEDETALVIYALWHYYETTKDKALIKKLYAPLIKKAADFMCHHVHNDLPKESYDLWEERQGISTFTCTTVCKGLHCAADLARVVGKKDATTYQKTAKKVHTAIGKHLYDKEKKRFLRMIAADDFEKKDATVESTLYSTFAFCGLPADDKKVVSTMKQVEEALSVKTTIGGVARYENDSYHRATDHTPGNPWFISTIWLAKWYLATAKSKKDLSTVKDTLTWCVQRSLETGAMPEQINPLNGAPLSVSPLTWSHAEFVWLVQDYIKKYDAL